MLLHQAISEVKKALGATMAAATIAAAWLSPITCALASQN